MRILPEDREGLFADPCRTLRSFNRGTENTHEVQVTSGWPFWERGSICDLTGKRVYQELKFLEAKKSGVQSNPKGV